MSPSSTATVTSATIRGSRLRRTAGLLVADRGRVEFRTARGRVFRVRLTEVEAVAWPWWWFGAQLRITVRGEQYRITFGSTDDEPRSDTQSVSTADTDASLLDVVIVLVRIVAGLHDWFVGRSAVRQWRELLPPSRTGGSTGGT